VSSFKNIRAVVFDLDGTLRHGRPSYNDAFFDIATRLGIDDFAENRKRNMRWLHYYWAQSAELMDDLETFVESQEAFWTNHAQRALVALGCTPSRAAALAFEVYQHMTLTYQPEDWVPEDVPQALQTLQSAGYRLGVLSNRTHSYQEQLAAMGLAGFFEFALAAGEIDSWKPEPGIFHHAVDLLKMPAGEMLYVGDNYYADVVGARRAGLQAVLIDRDRTFPDADCAVIRVMGDLPALLAGAASAL
jgi:2-haloalkanoic acid dehalogenase type II